MSYRDVVMGEDLTGRTLLGRLRVIRQLGSGGFGAVYEVEVLADGTRRALKVLHGRDGMSPVAASRLVREAGVAARVGSPRLVKTFEVAQLEDGRPFLLMELLDGETWKEHVRRRARLRPADAARLAIQVCEGLAAVHAAGVVHRDLKPDNVFLVGEPGHEQVKLLDFGLVKNLPGHTDALGHLTGAGALMGTPRYVAPEQASGRPDIDGRVDQYALGVMLYEALGGQTAFPGGSIAEILVKIAEGRVEPLAQVAPDLPPGLVAVVARAMHRDRDARHPSALALADALRPYAGAGPRLAVSSTAPMSAFAPRPQAIPARASSPRVPSSRPVRSPAPARTLLWLALGLVLVLGLLGALAAAAMVALRGQGEPLARPAPSQPVANGMDNPFTPPRDARDAATSRELELLFDRGLNEQCLARAEDAEPSSRVLELRVICAANAECWDLYRRLCAELAVREPRSPMLAHSCDRTLPFIPPGTPGRCTYPQ